MVKAIPDILARIVDQKKAAPRRLTSQLVTAAERSIADRRDFAGALTAATPAIIAEIKKASPSRGLLSEHFDPVQIAREYERGRAAALSVLTEEPNFQGSLEDLKNARAAVSVPVLRKDFTIGEYDVFEAAGAGADAVLLIVAILEEHQLRTYRELAEGMELAAIVEVHDDAELAVAAASGAKIIGVNNRDLRTFEVNIDTAIRLGEKMPDGVVRIAESGIHSGADVQRLQAAGYNAFLVGEHLMKSGDPAGAIEALLR